MQASRHQRVWFSVHEQFIRLKNDAKNVKNVYNIRKLLKMTETIIQIQKKTRFPF